MDDDQKLTASDYYNRPFKELVEHPDFSSKAMEMVLHFMEMTTEEIEKLDIPTTEEVT